MRGSVSITMETPEEAELVLRLEQDAQTVYHLLENEVMLGDVSSLLIVVQPFFDRQT